MLADSDARVVVWDESVSARDEIASSRSLVALELSAFTRLPLPSLDEEPLAAPAIFGFQFRFEPQHHTRQFVTSRVVPSAALLADGRSDTAIAVPKIRRKLAATLGKFRGEFGTAC